MTAPDADAKAKASARMLSRSWDAFDAYLFDIDGTLINCTDATHYFAFCEALQELSGQPLNLDGVTAHGNTDVGILRDVLTEAGIPESEWRGRIREACNGMADFVERRSGLGRMRTLRLRRIGHQRRRRFVSAGARARRGKLVIAE